jgi:hypothetical protein
MREPTRAELRAALDAIAAHHPDADVVVRGVASAYALDEHGQAVLHLDADRRASLDAGDEYRTWVVTLFAGEAVAVTSFRSRACAAGDDTLPG